MAPVDPVTRRRIWRLLNRGVVRRIALELGVTPAMVHMVVIGARRSRRIEAALVAAGAPPLPHRRRTEA